MKDNSLKTAKKAEELQDRIFKEMPAEKKIKLTSELSSFCIKLNSLNGNIKPGKTTGRNS